MENKVRKDKEVALYSVMLDKLYDYFVVGKKEAKMDDVIGLLSVLRFAVLDFGASCDDAQNSEEVDLL